MSTAFQVTFDAADPHALARFWALALSYVKEDHTEFVRQLLEAGHIRPEQTVEVDGGLAFAEAAACRDPDGAGPRLYFQRVPEPKQAKNRVHLDLRVGPAAIEREGDRLVALGARRLWYSDDRGGPCLTLADPEGNELCLT